MYKINPESLSAHSSKKYDCELFHDLINGRDIYSTKESVQYYEELVRVGALFKFKNNYHWAMLCIAYAINKGFSQDIEKIKKVPKSKSMAIEFKTCFQNQSHLWLAVLSEQLFRLYPNKQITQDDLYQYISQIWHIGAEELFYLWHRCKEFTQNINLESRQRFAQEIANLAHKNIQKSSHFIIEDNNTKKHNTQQNQQIIQKIQSAFDNLSIGTKSIEYHFSGLRYDGYQIQLKKYYDLTKKCNEICSALGKNNHEVLIENAHNELPFSYHLKLLRKENEWINKTQKDLEKDLQQFTHSNIYPKYQLPICIGIDEYGNPIFKDLLDAPHIFVTGMTKSGKSACMRGILHSLFTLNSQPQKIEVVILDIARVDYAVFEQQPNLFLQRIIKEPEQMLGVLQDTVQEMDTRLKQMEELHVQNWAQYRTLHPAPYRIIIIDELAGLLKLDKNILTILERLTAESRKAGMHCILSTQTANSETFSQTLRINVPSRLAMKVDTADQSKTALDKAGAENLLGRGDHLIKWVGEAIQFAHSYHI